MKLCRRYVAKKVRALLTRHTVHPPDPVCLPTTRMAEGLLTAMAHSPGQVSPGLAQDNTDPQQRTNVLEQTKIGENCPKTDLAVILHVRPFRDDLDGDSASIDDNFSITNNHGSSENLSFSSRGNSSVGSIVQWT